MFNSTCHGPVPGVIIKLFTTCLVALPSDGCVACGWVACGWVACGWVA